MPNQIVLSHDLAREAQKRWDEFRTPRRPIAGRRGIRSVPQLAGHLKQAFAVSDFILKNCARNPEMTAALFESGDLYRAYDASAYIQGTRIRSSKTPRTRRPSRGSSGFSGEER